MAERNTLQRTIYRAQCTRDAEEKQMIFISCDKLKNLLFRTNIHVHGGL